MRRIMLACATGLAVAVTLYLLALPGCGGQSTQTTPPCTQGDGSWFRSASDPKCCAPVHNQYMCSPADASADVATCAPWETNNDDAAIGARFPVGCSVNLTSCNPFYEGSPQPCGCDRLPDGAAAWTCGI